MGCWEIRPFDFSKRSIAAPQRPASEPPAPVFRGAALTAQTTTTAEWLLSGPSETGKTFAALYRLDSLLRAYAGARAALVRKVRATMVSTVLETWETVIALRGGVTVYGGKRPEWYDYPNGGRVYIGGMDDPGKVLSGERDFIFVNQAEELAREDWETLLTRATGRAGHAPFAMLFGDCNPGSYTHWILARASLLRLESAHPDNPTLYDDVGQLTERGRATMERLRSLTGTLRSRLLDGQWVAAEGAIYGDVWSDGPPDGNVTEEADYQPDAGDVLWACDDGSSGALDANGYYTAASHPRVILFAQLRHDGSICIFDELLSIDTRHDTDIAAALARPYPAPDYAVVDSSAKMFRIWLRDNAGCSVFGGTADVREGIRNLRNAISPNAVGWRRVRVHPRCRHLRAEMVSYQWGEGDKPVKAFDHTLDALRYLAWQLRYE